MLRGSRYISISVIAGMLVCVSCKKNAVDIDSIVIGESENTIKEVNISPWLNLPLGEPLIEIQSRTNEDNVQYASIVTISSVIIAKEISQEIINEGNIVIYWKTTDLLNDPSKGLMLIPKIQGGKTLASGVGRFKIPKRATNSFDDYQPYEINISQISPEKIYWSINFTSLFDQNKNKTEAEELLNLSKEEYLSFFVEMPLYKIIAVPKGLPTPTNYPN